MANKYDWDKIIKICQELIAQTDDICGLSTAVGARIGRDISHYTLSSGLRSHLKLDSRKFSEIKSAMSVDDDAASNLSPLSKILLPALRRERDKAFTIIELCNLCDRSPSSVFDAIGELVASGFYVQVTDDRHVVMPKDIMPTFERIPVELWTKPDTVHRYGVVSDTHLGNRNARLDIMESLYDIFLEEGIEIVLHCGNVVDGECRLNRHELLAHGVEGQIAFAAQNYPKRDGIVTKFLTADDHEGWWAKDAGFDIGRHMENGFRERGRDDLIWIGHVERDLSLHDDNPQAVLRLMHPGGGSAYSISYKPQKIAESMQGGEKPSVFLLGHYHKYGAFYYREIWFLMAGTGCDQTMFMRKQPLGADVGGSIVEVRMTPMGGIGRIKHEWFPFYNKDYYQKWDYSSMFGFIFKEE